MCQYSYKWLWPWEHNHLSLWEQRTRKLEPETHYFQILPSSYMNLMDAEFELAHSGYYPLISVIIWGELPRKETKIPNLPMCVSTNFLLIKRPMIIQFKTKRDSLVKTEHPLISFWWAKRYLPIIFTNYIIYSTISTRVNQCFWCVIPRNIFKNKNPLGNTWENICNYEVDIL